MWLEMEVHISPRRPAGDVDLLLSRFADLQEKTVRLAAIAGIVGLKINPRKTKTLRMNHRCMDYIRIEGEEVEDVESFVYLGSVLDKLSSSEADIKDATSTSENCIHQFSEHLEVRQIQPEGQKTKLCILNLNVLSVLLYRPKCGG